MVHCSLEQLLLCCLLAIETPLSFEAAFEIQALEAGNSPSVVLDPEFLKKIKLHLLRTSTFLLLVYQHTLHVLPSTALEQIVHVCVTTPVSHSSLQALAT